ncbi:hypothetical protein N7540_007382 [Penicillium herquei]|nr:hypothetical protein N7540_007382 [Penicillium herquei]
MPPNASEKPLSMSGSGKSYDCKDSETRIAAYLGLTATSDLRQLIFAWPFLKAVPKVHSEWKRLPRNKILSVLAACESEVQAVTDISSIYASDPKDTHDQTSTKRYKKIAWHLLQLDKDIVEYDASSDEESTQKAVNFIEPCLATLADYELEYPTLGLTTQNQILVLIVERFI